MYPKSHSTPPFGRSQLRRKQVGVLAEYANMCMCIYIYIYIFFFILLTQRVFPTSSW